MADALTLSITRISPSLEHLEVPSLELRLESPGEPARAVPLGVNGVTVGSGPECALVATDGSISRVHCRVQLTTNGVRIRDLGSKNGCVIRGVPVLEAPLNAGDVVMLGRSQLTLRSTGAPKTVPLSRAAHFGEALGASPVMRAVFEQLTQAAKSDVPVLLEGESGTGKELLARAVHEHSPRQDGPFVVFDCGAVAPSLVESELFGALKGAFTGADRDRKGLLHQAHGGTVFLDEIGELPLELQPKLLRALESKEIRPVGANTYERVDVRVVAATHRDIKARSAAGQFRPDLYFRLAVAVVEVPALRERKDDLPLLVEHFLKRQQPPRGLDALPVNALKLMEAHDWPGNVRELWNTVTRWVLFPQRGAANIQGGPSRDDGFNLDAVAALSLRDARELIVTQFEEVYVRRKLSENGQNVSAAARAMGVSRQFLYRLLDKLGLQEQSRGE